MRAEEDQQSPENEHHSQHESHNRGKCIGKRQFPAQLAKRAKETFHVVASFPIAKRLTPGVLSISYEISTISAHCCEWSGSSGALMVGCTGARAAPFTKMAVLTRTLALPGAAHGRLSRQPGWR